MIDIFNESYKNEEYLNFVLPYLYGNSAPTYPRDLPNCLTKDCRMSKIYLAIIGLIFCPLLTIRKIFVIRSMVPGLISAIHKSIRRFRIW